MHVCYIAHTKTNNKTGQKNHIVGEKSEKIAHYVRCDVGDLSKIESMRLSCMFVAHDFHHLKE